MIAFFMRLRRPILTFLHDDTGVILPYVAIMLVAFIGLGALALDAGRYMSMQTQMQAVADALALAGAKELNQQPGARARATNAINAMVSNGLTGLGYSGAITNATPVFYSALPAATAGFTGTAATSDFNAKFVAVTVNPVTIPTVMPISFFKSGASNNFSTGARAIAGFTSRAVCDMPPVFICNPYESAGMSDGDATQALNTNIALPSVQRQQVRLDPTKSGPGQFGYLMPPDGCTGASCLENWIALAKPKTCYQKAGVDLNTGFKASVTDGFNVRFDIYLNNLKNDKGNANYAPALNVRKGFFLAKGTNWCSAQAATPYPYLNQASTAVAAIFPNSSTLTANGTFTASGCKGKGSDPCLLVTLTDANIVSKAQGWIGAGLAVSIVSANIPAGTAVRAACPTPTSSAACTAAGVTANNTLVMSADATAAGSAAITVGLSTSGLPMDTSLVGNTNTFGNGQWDCDSYWRINHRTAPPDMSADIKDTTGQISAGGVCSTPANTTVSRYHVYLYENANAALISQYSLPASIGAGGENGQPQCNGSGVGPSANQTDRRLIYSAVVNCLANGPFGGGQTANNIPVAGFAKVFMTQPVQADGYIYGEMSGLVGSLDNVKILNQVQLYR